MPHPVISASSSIPTIPSAAWLVLLPHYWDAFVGATTHLSPSETHFRPFLTDLFATLDGIGQFSSWNSLFFVSSDTAEFLFSSSFLMIRFLSFYGILIPPFPAFSYLPYWYYQRSVFVPLSYSSYFNWSISFDFVPLWWWFLNLLMLVFQNATFCMKHLLYNLN